MAYDPNDPADKATVQALIDAALEEQREEHEAEIIGLKDKNKELLGKIRKARTGGDDASAAEVERLETELADVQGKLRTSESSLRQVNRDLAARTIERDNANAALDTERTFSRDTLVNSELTSALVAAKVKPEFLEDVTASLSRGVTIKEVDGKRQAFVGDKPLGAFVTEWSQGDKGKHYVGAPANGGGGTGNPGNPQGGNKKIYEMTGLERAAAHAADPAGFEARVKAGEAKAPPK
jgi:hypothetical protein